MNDKRIQWIDFGKGFTIFCVVLYHSIMIIDPSGLLNLIKQFCSIFMMPVFFAISGYLYKSVKSNTDFIQLIYKKISSFVIPYLFFTIIIFYFYKWKLIYHSTWNPNIFSIFFVSKFTYLWFLYVLFIIFIFVGSINFFFTCKNLLTRILLIILMAFLLIGIYYFGTIGFLLCIICFIIGHLLNHFKFFYNKNYVKLIDKIPILWVIILMMFYIINLYFDNKLIFMKNIFYITSPVIFFVIFIHIRHGLVFSYFCKYGKYTLAIYLMHFPIIYILTKINMIYKIPVNATILSLFTVIITWMVCILFCNICLRLKSFYYIFYPRKWLDNKFKTYINH